MTLDFQVALLQSLYQQRELKRYVKDLPAKTFTKPLHQAAMELLKDYVARYKVLPSQVGALELLAEQLEGLPHDELVRIVETMEEDMRNASAAMDFEEAARLRDAVVQIRAMLEGASEDETIERLRSQARKGSTFASGRKRQGARFKK